MSKYYVGDIGVKIVVDTGIDISNATVLQLKVRKPDNTEVDWTATFEGLTKLSYTIISGDWTQAGRYLLQSYVETPTWKAKGETTSFEVYYKFK